MTRMVGAERSAANGRTPLGALAELTRSLLTHPGGKGRRAATMARAARWQLRRLTGERRADVRFGPMRIRCYPGYSSASSVLYFGLPEWNEMLFVLRFLRPGDTLVDVGANIGAYALLATTAIPGLRTIAVEPDADARARLEENLALNSGTEIQIVAAALGAEPGEARMTEGRDTLNRLARPGDEVTGTVALSTLDSLCSGPPPALVKIDVEGAELEVLRGAERTLAGTPAPVLLLEIIDDGLATFGVTRADVAGFLQAHGYHMFEYDAASRRCDPWTGADATRTGYVAAVKDTARLEARLAERRPDIERLLTEAPRVTLER